MKHDNFFWICWGGQRLDSRTQIFLDERIQASTTTMPVNSVGNEAVQINFLCTKPFILSKLKKNEVFHPTFYHWLETAMCATN